MHASRLLRCLPRLCLPQVLKILYLGGTTKGAFFPNGQPHFMAPHAGRARLAASCSMQHACVLTAVRGCGTLSSSAGSPGDLLV